MILGRRRPYFSVIIPTLDEEECLPDLLGDLTKQNFNDFEVIHVDGNSTDRTVRRARKYLKKLDMVILSTKTQNVGHQRNLGAQKSRGEWVVYMDADVRIRKDFLRVLRRELESNDGVDMFSCKLDVSMYKKRDRKYITFINAALKLAEHTLPQAMGAMLGIRQEIVDEVKYDETLNNGEDRKYIQEVLKKGYEYDLLCRPRYMFSLRRIKKEGLMRMLGVYAQNTLKFAAGIPFENNQKTYPMKGGKYYRE